MDKTLEYITIGLSSLQVLAIVIGAFVFLRKPQEKTEITDAVFKEKISNLNADLANLRDNHLHTLEVKLDSHISDNTKYNMETAVTLSRLETILNERLPVKK